MIIDIHSHILPAVDDGAKNIEESVKLLEMMKEQGITDVFATPHFVATQENLDEYIQKVSNSYNELLAAVEGKDFPKIHIGSEVFYFNGIGKSSSIKKLCLDESNYLLLELPNCSLNNYLLSNIKDMKDNLGITPIIAHIERYCCEKGFKNLLTLIKEGYVLAQLNASSIVNSPYKKVAFKLIKRGYISFIATDSHSPVNRPPLLEKALSEISIKFGSRQKMNFIKNSENLYKEIIGETQREESYFEYQL